MFDITSCWGCQTFFLFLKVLEGQVPWKIKNSLSHGKKETLEVKIWLFYKYTEYLKVLVGKDVKEQHSECPRVCL